MFDAFDAAGYEALAKFGVAGNRKDAAGDALGIERIDQDSGVAGNFHTTAGVGGDGGRAAVKRFEQRNAEALELGSEQQGQRVPVDLRDHLAFEVALEVDLVAKAEPPGFGFQLFASRRRAAEDKVQIRFAFGGGNPKGFQNVSVILMGPEIRGEIEVFRGKFEGLKRP